MRSEMVKHAAQQVKFIDSTWGEFPK